MSSLYEETTINGLTLKNRFVRGAIYNGMANPDGSYPQRMIDFMTSPAKGGVGVVRTSPQEVIQPLTESEQKALVDEFIAVNHEKKHLEKRLDEIRTQLLPLGEIGSDKFLQGSGGEGIVLTLTRIAKLPTKSNDSAAVDGIWKMMQQGGLLDNYLSLDTTKLQKAYTSGALPDVLMEKLKPYELIEIQDRVRIKRK